MVLISINLWNRLFGRAVINRLTEQIWENLLWLEKHISQFSYKSSQISVGEKKRNISTKLAKKDEKMNQFSH